MKKAATAQNKQLFTILGGVFGLLLSYAFISRAFSTGSYWHYLAFIVFLILGAKLLAKALKK